MNKLSQFFRKLFTREIFKPIRDYEGLYEISNYGKVKSLAKQWISGKGTIRKKENTILKGGIDEDGYRIVTLYKNKKKKTYRMACLVWDHFGNRKRNGYILQIDHIDGNKQNNRIDNLQLLTCRENITKEWEIKKKTSKFVGVNWHKEQKKWQARILINKKRRYLGLFESEHKANLKYQEALREIK